MSEPVEIRGDRVVLRALRPDEIDDEWRAMLEADPMAIATVPDERAFRRRLERSGRMVDGWLDLAIEVEGRSIGRIQTFIPPFREVPPDVYTIGIGLRESLRGKGYGREALALLTDWLFQELGAARVEAPTDPANAAMRSVFERVGWTLVQTRREFDRDWVEYAITRAEWEDRRAG